MNPTKATKNYFGKEVLVLKIFGLSLTGNESLPYKIYSFLFLSATVFTYPLLDFYEYFKHDASAIADIIIYQIGTVVVSCNIAVVLRNRVTLGKLLAKLEREPFIPNLHRGGPVEEEIVGEYVRVTRAQTLLFWGFTCVTIIFAMLYTVINRIRSDDYHDWQMPYGPLTLLNATHSPNYEINWFYQNISVVFFACLCITIDVLLAAVLAHIAYQFKILQNFLKRIVENSHKNMMEVTNGPQHISSNQSIITNETDTTNIPWEYLKKPIVEFVEYHEAIIDIAKEIEEIFSVLLLFTFLGTLALICFSTYAASSADSLQSAAKHIGEGVVVSVRVAFVCFWGEQVFQESQLVGQAAYESDFVGTDLRFQKMLAFIIRRSQNPIKITAGMFTDIRLETLFWILRTSYSAFMILRKSNI